MHPPSATVRVRQAIHLETARDKIIVTKTPRTYWLDDYCMSILKLPLFARAVRDRAWSVLSPVLTRALHRPHVRVMSDDTLEGGDEMQDRTRRNTRPELVLDFEEYECSTA